MEPDNPEALAEAIRLLYRDPKLRISLGSAGLRDVEQFEMNRVAARFLAEIARVAPAFRAESLRVGERNANESAIGATKT